MDPKKKFRRFCWIGSFEPVVTKRCGYVDASLYWPQLNEICEHIEPIMMTNILTDAIVDERAMRIDEPLFACAVYLMGDVKMEWKLIVRKRFPVLIQNDRNLFLFLHYVKQIQNVIGKKNFSRTIIKTVQDWYRYHATYLLDFECFQRIGHFGFTHKWVIRIFRITDSDIGSKGTANIMIKSSRQVRQLAARNGLLIEGGQGDVTPNSSLNSVIRNNNNENENNKAAKRSADADEIKRKKMKLTELSNQKVANAMALTQLSTVKENESQAYEIIRTFDLPYDLVPHRFFKFISILSHYMESMPYKDLLLVFCHYIYRCQETTHNRKLVEQARNLLCDTHKMHEAKLHPIIFLLTLCRNSGTSKPELLLASQFDKILREAYYLSFGHNVATGLRFHITMDIQMKYHKRPLHSCRYMQYLDAAVGLAFGYYKIEKDVDIFQWSESALMLKPIEWNKEMTVTEATETCINGGHVKNVEKRERLTAPIRDALFKRKVYDVFLIIVPTAALGNPGQKPDLIHEHLQKYRKVTKGQAKYIIVDLIKTTKSMNYPSDEDLNILEICGLDEHTPNMINEYILNNFD